MGFLDLIKLSTRMFKARTSRTILTVLGMGVGIGAILFLVSLGYGLQKTLLNKITTSDSLLTLDVSESSAEEIKMDSNKIKEIENIDGVSEVSPRFNVSAQGKIGELTSDLMVAGIKPSFLKLGGLRMFRGKSISDEEPNGVIMTSSSAQAFNISVDEIVGENIEFVFSLSEQNNSDPIRSESKKIPSKNKYKVIGIIEEDENIIYVNSVTLENLNVNRFDQLKVKCLNSNFMGSVRDEISGLGFMVSSLSDAVDQANKVFRVIQMVLGGFGVIALIVSAIGMFNTMTIALLERTTEIGVMKSIGASDLNISMIFATEATIMGFLGGLGGVVMGLATGNFFNILINTVAVRFGGEKLDLFYTPLWFIIIIISFGTIVGLMTGIIPARRASKIDPLDALKNK
jgi:ABC-type antimicrobial peptide transport system permease subunit